MLTLQRKPAPAATWYQFARRAHVPNTFCVGKCNVVSVLHWSVAQGYRTQPRKNKILLSFLTKKKVLMEQNLQTTLCKFMSAFSLCIDTLSKDLISWEIKYTISSVWKMQNIYWALNKIFKVNVFIPEQMKSLSSVNTE